MLPFRRPASAVRVRRRSPWLVLGRPLRAGAPAGRRAGRRSALWLFSSPTFALAAVERRGQPLRRARLGRPGARSRCCGANLLSLPLPLVEDAAVDESVGRGRHGREAPAERAARRRSSSAGRRRCCATALDARLPRRAGQVDRALRSRLTRGPRDLLLVSVAPATGAEPAGAFAVGARARSERAATGRRRLSEVEVLGEGDFRLYLGALAFPAAGARRNPQRERWRSSTKLLPELSQPLREARIRRSPIRSSDHFSTRTRERGSRVMAKAEQYVVGIDIGSSKVAVLIGQRDEQGRARGRRPGHRSRTAARGAATSSTSRRPSRRSRPRARRPR